MDSGGDYFGINAGSNGNPIPCFWFSIPVGYYQDAITIIVINAWLHTPHLLAS